MAQAPLPLTASRRDPPSRLAPLLDAVSTDALGAALGALLRHRHGCPGARLLWNLACPKSVRSVPAGAPNDGLPGGGLPDGGRLDDVRPDDGMPDDSLLDDAALQLLRDALDSGVLTHDRARPQRIAVPLPRSEAALLLEADTAATAVAIAREATDALEVADRRLRTLLEIEELQRTLARLEHSEQVQRALFAISDLAGSDRDMDEVLRGIHAIVGTLMYAENFYIVEQDLARATMRFLYLVDTQDTAPVGDIPLASFEYSLTGYLLSEGRPLRGSAEQLAAQVPGPLRQIGADSHDWMGVPMLRDGQVQGAIVLQSYQPGISYTAEDQALLEFVGSHILTALERKRSQEHLEASVRLRTQELAQANAGLQLEIVERERAEHLQRALFQIAQLATADLGEEEFYRRIHEVVGALLNARNFFIALLSDDRRELDFPYYIDSRHTDRKARRPLGRGLSEFVLRHARPLLGTAPQILDLAACGEIEIATAGPPAVCWLGVPLVFGDEAVGLVAVQSYDPEVIYGVQDQQLLGFVASQIANSLNRRRAAQIQQRAFELLEVRVAERTHELRKEIGERERVQEQLKHEVMHDALTGLPNRSHLRDRLNQVLARLRREPDRHCALLYLDVDRFKVINDSLGHQAGDEMLRVVAQRLQACVREPDLVARLSGDEFAVLLEHAETPAGALRVAQRVLELLATPVEVAGKLLAPSASIGVAIGDDGARSGDDLLRDADKALYRAKALGRSRYVLFDASLQREAVDVLTMEAELRVALEQDQFEPHFQPITRLDSGEIVGYEALLRWNHPTRGVLGPPDFLQIAEDCGAIDAIDWRMFELSCTAAARLRRTGTYLTINVSPRHLRHEDFDAQLIGVLQRTGLSATRLLTEVTEGSLLDDPARVRGTLGRLQLAGVGTALDDFGTGYSSLSYLHTFPLKMLKIDRAFVAELGSAGKQNSTSIMAAILALARALGMDVVAEGIETDQQRDALVALGCRYGQGFLLGRPAPMGHWLAGQDAADDLPAPP